MRKVFYLFLFHEHIPPFWCFFSSLIIFLYGNIQNNPNTKQYPFELMQNSLRIYTWFYFFYANKFILNLENQYFYASASTSYYHFDCSIRVLYLMVWMTQITWVQSKQFYFCCFGNGRITYWPLFVRENDKEDYQTSPKPYLLMNLHILTSYFLEFTIIMMLFYFFLILIS